ncbi:MAG: hypothetical protein VX494_10075 [Actinomycetota bacterium]|nr:hypothetical protein [Actinomycetota bacterium]
MKFRTQPVLALPTKASDYDVRLHVVAYPLDVDAEEVGLWRLAPRTLCGRSQWVEPGPGTRAGLCLACTEHAAFMDSSCIAFERHRARMQAERSVG